ncbi:hypothetical protein ACE1CI_02680 [Aerosakkonemataceae cyanobacterium BLCC-F50]|uniref:Uncharacterized protein n=1 Tax=Floridaenema flaviceps BLCC-F50 TaxID=3153642 RepID=A0ABV4XLG0_9CYAN
MTKTEILQALKQMTTDERLEIIEAASIMMREEIAEKAKRKAEREEKLAAAVQDAIPDYMPGGCLYDLWSPESEPYYKSEDEIPGGGLEKNA